MGDIVSFENLKARREMVEEIITLDFMCHSYERFIDDAVSKRGFLLDDLRAFENDIGYGGRRPRKR